MSIGLNRDYFTSAQIHSRLTDPNSRHGGWRTDRPPYSTLDHPLPYAESAIMMLSAVRLPTPPPHDAYPLTFNHRKRSPPSRSPPPVRRRSPPRNGGLGGGSVLKDASLNVGDDRERHLTERLRPRAAEPVDSKPLTAEDKQELAKKEYNKLLSARSGGTYVPPARLRALQSQVTDKASKEYQRMAWEALKKSINGLVNKINVGNIKNIVPELFGENLVRGKGNKF